MLFQVLVVEDEPAMAQGLKDNLEIEGYQVAVCSDGEHGLRTALAERPDLILLDVMLPKLSGLDVCKTLRSRGFSNPILMLTARGQEMDRVVGLEIGADDYIVKPFSHANCSLASTLISEGSDARKTIFELTASTMSASTSIDTRPRAETRPCSSRLGSSICCDT